MTKKSKVKPVKKAVSKSKTIKVNAPPTVTCTSKLKQSAERSSTQEALQVTWLLKGNLKNVQLSYLRVGKLFAQVRDKNLYSALGHANIEDYAEKRLQLGRTSLYKYLQVYDWVSKTHPEWLLPKPKGFIPELYDVAGLILIENGLKQKNVSPQKRAKLQELKTKALAGELRKGELKILSKSSAMKVDPLKSFTSGLKVLRKKADGVSGIPAEVIAHLDAALALLNNEKALAYFQLMPERAPMMA